VICDPVSIPLWKNINLSNTTNSQDGWLVQGSVANGIVTDPMYLMVSNISHSCDAFFSGIPYSGPQVILGGAQDGDIVSNTIKLEAMITDLSGATANNQQLAVAVNGLPARWSLGPSNTISLDTHYAPSGAYQVIAADWSSFPVVFDLQNPPMDMQVTYDTPTTLSLDFENSAFLVNSGDMCGPEVGTNYIIFGVNQPDTISATISDPSNGKTLASYSGYVPNAGQIALAWNFTQTNGLPYTNDSYAIHFVANDPADLLVTNTISRQGVRYAGGVIITHAGENPNDPFGSLLNSYAQTWIDQTLGGASFFL